MSARKAEQAPTPAVGAVAATNEIRDLRALLHTVLDAITLPYGTPNYEARLDDRADWARTMRKALDEDPRDLGWNADWLRSKLDAEEKKARLRHRPTREVLRLRMQMRAANYNPDRPHEVEALACVATIDTDRLKAVLTGRAPLDHRIPGERLAEVLGVREVGR
ncbi:hypothetical protein ACIP4X_14065 [Streptomyces sp. NPDC088817]|uniref:hypothetical protein n=1 Tax=Streptomyces sp. NPDC088817 TaxID=3365907 RepID=UPI0038282754